MLLNLYSINLIINEAGFKTVFFALKRYKSCGYDEINANIVQGFMKKWARLSFIFFSKLLRKVFFQKG